jgi:hypothetical protein
MVLIRKDDFKLASFLFVFYPAIPLLRPLSYLGAARPLMLPLFRLLPYLYLPDRSTAYTGLTSAVAAISMLSSYRPNTSTSVRTMPTFLIRLAFPTFI